MTTLSDGDTATDPGEEAGDEAGERVEPQAHPTQHLDDVVHQRARLGILAVLAEAGRADFTFVAAALDLTNGNLSRHLRVLEDSGLIAQDKRIEGRRPRTWLKLTPAGRIAFDAELSYLQALVNRHTLG